jgi:hypothetical protein
MAAPTVGTMAGGNILPAMSASGDQLLAELPASRCRAPSRPPGGIKPKRPQRKKRVTLIAAFRCDVGVIICADSQETVGQDWRVPVDKIKPHEAGGYQVVIGGSGDDGPLIDAFTKQFVKEVGTWKWGLSEEDLGEGIRFSLSNYLENKADVPQGVNIGIDFIVCIRRKTDGKVFLWKLFGPDVSRGPLIVSEETFTLAGIDFPYVHEVRRLYRGNAPALRCVLLGVHLFKMAAETSNYIGGPTQVIFMRDTSAWPTEYLQASEEVMDMVWVEAPERVRGLEAQMDTLNRMMAELLLICPDTTITSAELKDRLARFQEEVMKLRAKCAQEATEISIEHSVSGRGVLPYQISTPERTVLHKDDPYTKALDSEDVPPPDEQTPEDQQ